MNSDSVKLLLKIKPEFSKSPSVSQIINQNLFSLNNRLYKFDYIAPQFTTNQEFFEMTISPLIQEFLSGESVIFLTHGQSESGKTYTLFGGNTEKGIIEMTCERLTQDCKGESVSCRFLEIFQEAVFDLFSQSAQDEKGKGIDLMSEVNIKTAEDTRKMLQKAQKKIIGGKKSTIFELEIKNRSQKMIFVDLTNSEKVKSSVFNSDKAKKTGFLNKSLSALRNVLKSIAIGSPSPNYQESKLTWLLKDCLKTSKVILMSTISPSKKHFIHSASTLKFSQKLKKIWTKPDLEILETNIYLENRLKDQSTLLKFYKEQEENYKQLQLVHSGCEQKQKIFTENIQSLENEVRMLRKELIDLEKIGNSDWLLSSDSDEREGYLQISKEKSELEQSLAATNEKLSGKTKEASQLTDKILLLEKDIEKQLEIISHLTLEVDELKSRCSKYQELCVLLGKLNSNLASELKTSSDKSPELQDLSTMSSTEVSKLEFYKIIEEKYAMTVNLAENCKITEDSLNKLKEKYLSDTSMLKKTIAKLKKELEVSKAENIKENQYAMQILENLKAEKNKLLSVIEDLSVYSDKHKMIELKEINNLLAERLKTKGQQIAGLQRKFLDLLEEKEGSDVGIKQISDKKKKIQEIKQALSRTPTHFSKFPQYRKMDNRRATDFSMEIFRAKKARMKNLGSIGEIDVAEVTS